MSSLTTAAVQKAIFAVGGPVDLRKYTKLKPAIAQQIHCNEDVDLSGLKELSPETAAAFKHHRGGLIFDGLKELSPKTALALKENFEGTLSFGGLEKIEDEAARYLAEREAGDHPYKYWPKTLIEGVYTLEDTPGHLALFGKLSKGRTFETIRFRKITPSQAQILIERTDPIDLWKLEELNPEVAEILSKFPKGISLGSMKKISKETAEAFAPHKGELTLNSLDPITDDVAMGLSKHQGPLNISGIAEMPDTPGFIELAKTLAKYPQSISPRIEKIGDKVAEALSGNPKLCLQLTELAETQGYEKLANALINSNLEKIEFWGLKKIPDNILAILLSGEKPIKIPNLSHWTDKPAHIALANQIISSPDSIGIGSQSIYIHGEKFPDRIADIFANAPNVSFAGVKELDSSPGNLSLAKRLAEAGTYINPRKLSAEAAEILKSKSSANIMLGDLIEIDSKTLKLLYPNESGLYLSKLEKLSDEVAQEMTGKREITLDGLAEISDASAKAFGQGEGSLSLNGITKFSLEALKEIAKREGELSLGGLTTLSPQEAEILKDHVGGLKLNKLEDAPLEALLTLAKIDPKSKLSLEALEEIPEPLAKILGQREGSLYCSSIKELNGSQSHIDLAKKLAKSYWRLEFNNIKTLSAPAAKELLGVSTITLKGLEKIDKPLGEAFSSYTQELNFPSLKEIDLDAAEELGKAPIERLTIGFIDQLSDEAFLALTKNKKKLTLSCETLTPSKAQILAQIPSLYIEKLKTMSFECAKCFKGYKGEIYMANLETLSSEAAAELRKLRKKLSTNRAGEYALATGA